MGSSLDGILAGNGDIYGRMVNADGVKPSYPSPLGVIVPLLYDSLKPESEMYGEGRTLADEFLATLTFPEEN